MHFKDKKYGVIKSAVLAMLLFILLAGNIRIADAAPKADAAPNNDEPEKITELEDYTEAYGWKPNDKEQRVRVESNQGARNAKTKREVVYLSVFVTFKDTPTKLNNPETIAAANMLLNTGGEVENIGGKYTVPSLKQSIERATYGKLSTTSYIFPRESAGSQKVVSYVAPHPREYYLKKSNTNPDGYTPAQQRVREAELISGAINAMNQQVAAEGIGQAQIDSDNDGNVDAISFFVGGGQSGVAWSDLLWSHKIDAANAPLPENTKILGKSISAWNLVNVNEKNNIPGGVAGEVFSLNRPAYAVIVHEYLHTLGLPDLYRSSRSGNPVGTYDIMAATTAGFPQGILAAMAEERGWHNPLPEVTSSQRVTLKKKAFTDPSEKVAVKIKSPYSDKEYFVAEFYARNKLEEFMGNTSTQDTYSDSDGLLISRYNTEEYNGNIGGGPGTDMLYVFRPGEVRPNEGKGSIKAATLNMGKNRTGLGKALGSGGFDNQTIYFSDGTNSGIVIKLDMETDNEITFDVTIPKVQGTGTKADPYLISEPSNFSLIRNLPEKYFKITKDIDFAAVNDFTPIKTLGSYKKTGVLDGNGKTIRNLTINNSDTNIAGFFENIDMLGIVKDLNFENLNITGHGVQVGGLAAAMSGTAENVTINSGNIVNTANAADFPGNKVVTGGITGYLRSTGKIINSYNSVNITSNVYAGGLAGESQNGALTNSYANGNIQAVIKGGAVGLFRAYDEAYNTDTKGTYYDKKATSADAAIGEVDGSVTVPKVNGITGVTAPEQIVLDLSGANEKALELTFDPKSGAVADPLEISAASTAIARVNSSNKIVGVSEGTTKATAKFPVGPHKMGLESDVVVIGGTKQIPTAADLKADLSSRIYNKKEQGVSVTAADNVTGLGAISVKYQKGTETATADKPITAGTYKVYADVAAGSRYQAAADILMGSYKINPLQITGSAVKIAPVKQDSPTQLTGKKLAVQGTNIIEGDKVNALDCTITFPTTANAGSFSNATVAVGELDNKNYSIANNRLENQNYTVEEVVKPVPTATELKADLSSRTYNKKEQGVSVTAADNVTGLGAISVKYQKGTETATADKPITAGTYKVYADVAAGSRYQAAADILIGSYKINPLEITGAAVKISPVKQDSPTQLTGKTLAVMGTNIITGDKVNAVNCTITFPSTAYAGSFLNATVMIGELDNKNYSIANNRLENQNYTVEEVVKPVPTATELKADLSSRTYNKKEQGVSVTAADNVTGLGAISVKYQKGTDPAAADKPASAGTYKVYADVEEGSKYQAASDILMGSYKITPLKISGGAVSIASVKQDSPKELTGQKLAVQGTNIIAGDKVNAVNCTITFPTTANAGSFSDATVAIGELDNKNYSIANNRLENQSYTVEAVAKPVPTATDLKADLSSRTYNKTEQGVGVTAADGVTGLGTISVRYQKETDPATADIPISAGTYKVYADLTEGSKYQAVSDILVGTYTIDPLLISDASVSIAPVQQDSATQLTGQMLAVQGTNIIGGDTVNAVNCTITFPSTAAAGTFSDATVTIGELDNKNYSIADNRLGNQTYHVTAITLNEIRITAAPHKTTYFEGESFDRTGMKVEGIWSDGTQTDISNQVAITPNGALGVGDTKVIISFGGQSIEQLITVNKVLPVKLEITAPPTKVKYTEGEVFDSTGLELTIVYNNGSTEVVTKGYQVTGNALSPGTTEVEITYEKDGQILRVSQPVTVSAKPDKPDQPVQPDKPDKPDQPDQSDKPNEEFTKVKLFNKETGITIEGSFTSEAQLKIKRLNQEVPEVIKKELANKIIIVGYDVSILKGTWQGQLTLHFPVDSGYNGTKVTIKHLRKDGTIETFEKTVVKGSVTVEVDELSPFAIAVDKKMASVDKPKPQADKVPVIDTTKKQAAKTGDSTPAAGMFLIILVSLAGIGYFVMRKRMKS